MRVEVAKIEESHTVAQHRAAWTILRCFCTLMLLLKVVWALQSECQDVVPTWLMVQGAAGKGLSLKSWSGSL